MEEAERCHTLAFLAQGDIVSEETPATIKESLGDIRLYSVNLAYTPQTMQYLSEIEDIVLINQFGNELPIMVKPKCNIEMIQNILKEKPYDLGNN